MTQLEKAKYTRRVPKAGGGYRYYYDEPKGRPAPTKKDTKKEKPKKEWPTEDHPSVDSQAVTELEMHADNTHSLYKQKEAFHKNVVTKMAQGKYNADQANKLWMYYADRVASSYSSEHGGSFGKPTRQALAHNLARDFEREVKDNPGDFKNLVPKKYQGAWGKSMSNNDAINELDDFVKSTIEDNSQPSIGESKKNGEGQSLAGKGKTSGNSSGPAQPIGAPGVSTKKLSEDDAIDEAQMKPHKKPIEKNTTRKSMPVHQPAEQMAYERAVWLSNLQKSQDVTPELGAPLQKAEEPARLSSDEQAAALVKSDTFYHGSNPTPINGNPLSTLRVCSCGGRFMKALTVCPHCGNE